jgi:hypothetical protein
LKIKYLKFDEDNENLPKIDSKLQIFKNHKIANFENRIFKKKNLIKLAKMTLNWEYSKVIKIANFLCQIFIKKKLDKNGENL